MQMSIGGFQGSGLIVSNIVLIWFDKNLMEDRGTRTIGMIHKIGACR
jgi:hypothetical protein